MATVGSLHPKMPRAVLTSSENDAGIRVWLETWKFLLANDPELAQTRLARAREAARVQAEAQAALGGESNIPTEEEMVSAYAVLSRIATLTGRPGGGKCQTPAPMRDDIQWCVVRGWVDATLEKPVAGISPPNAPSRWDLKLSGKGAHVLQMFEDHLVATGQK